MKIKHILIVLISLAFVSCRSAKSEEKSYTKIDSKEEKINVEAVDARIDKFNLELICNGKAAAVNKAILNFNTSDIVRMVMVRNGDRVNKGQLLASVDTYNSKKILNEAELNLHKTKLSLENELISSGYKFQDTSKVSKKIFDIMKLRSGYTSAQSKYEQAVHDYKNTSIYAPFSGVIADMNVKESNPSSEYDKFCLLLDDSKMEIVFDVLETEVFYLRKGMQIEACAYANPSLCMFGEITEVNPKIDSNGMVQLKAVINNKNASLVDGMNISIKVKREIENSLIVPKSAVLSRQGKKIVFVYEKGLAIWKYVRVGFENSNEVSIIEGLKEGEKVIFNNNLGLAHQTEVCLIKK